MSDKIKCYIIGADTLLTSCSQILLDKGHSIEGIISSNPEIAKWARQKELRVLNPKEDLVGTMSAAPFDYLFSIANLSDS